MDTFNDIHVNNVNLPIMRVLEKRWKNIGFSQLHFNSNLVAMMVPNNDFEQWQLVRNEEHYSIMYFSYFVYSATIKIKVFKLLPKDDGTYYVAFHNQQSSMTLEFILSAGDMKVIQTPIRVNLQLIFSDKEENLREHFYDYINNF